MKRSLIIKIHAAFSSISLLLIISFFTSTVIVELQGNPVAIQLIKQLIVYGIAFLVPAMAITGFSGSKLAGKSKAQLIVQKRKRMQKIMILGITILIPSALMLNYLAQNNSIGGLFYSLQMIELIAGGTNIYLMALNMREGFFLSGRIRRKKTAS